MHMHRCRCAGRPMAVVHAQQVLGRAEWGNGSNLRASLARRPEEGGLGKAEPSCRFRSGLVIERENAVIVDRLPGFGTLVRHKFVRVGELYRPRHT